MLLKGDTCKTKNVAKLLPHPVYTLEKVLFSVLAFKKKQNSQKQGGVTPHSLPR
jgi:hypothetical protein